MELCQHSSIQVNLRLLMLSQISDLRAITHNSQSKRHLLHHASNPQGMQSDMAICHPSFLHVPHVLYLNLIENIYLVVAGSVTYMCVEITKREYRFANCTIFVLVLVMITFDWICTRAPIVDTRAVSRCNLGCSVLVQPMPSRFLVTLQFHGMTSCSITCLLFRPFSVFLWNDRTTYRTKRQRIAFACIPFALYTNLFS